MLYNPNQSILTEWRDHYATMFGNQPLKLKHRLHESPLFTDEALAGLLESADRADYHVSTMDNGVRREGEFGDLSGAEILEAVRTGAIWVNLRTPAQTDPRYGELLDQIYSEFEARVPGLETFRQNMTILISSPNIKVKYHMDVPGQTLWQVRGVKKVYVYPAAEPFLPQRAIEKLVLGEAHETDMGFEPWYDEFAQITDLQPGEMLHWPLNGPHRVDNHDCLNVSITTEHWTKSLRNAYAVNYANGLLRKAGLNRLSQPDRGPGLWGRLALAGAVKFSGAGKKTAKPYQIDFRVDPEAPGAVRDITPYDLRK